MKIIEKRDRFFSTLEVSIRLQDTFHHKVVFNPIDDIYILIGHELMPRGYISVHLHAPS